MGSVVHEGTGKARVMVAVRKDGDKTTVVTPTLFREHEFGTETDDLSCSEACQFSARKVPSSVFAVLGLQLFRLHIRISVN